MEENYKALGCAVITQAIKDYFNKETDKEEKKEIIRDLKSPWMDYLTNGLSLMAAQQLKENPGAICRKLRKVEKEENNYAN